MTTGELMVMLGVGLVIAAVFLVAVGNIILHNRKKKILLEIEHEYR